MESFGVLAWLVLHVSVLIELGPNFAATRRAGSPAESPETLLHAPDGARQKTMAKRKDAEAKSKATPPISKAAKTNSSVIERLLDTKMEPAAAGAPPAELAAPGAHAAAGGAPEATEKAGAAPEEAAGPARMVAPASYEWALQPSEAEASEAEASEAKAPPAEETEKEAAAAERKATQAEEARKNELQEEAAAKKARGTLVAKEAEAKAKAENQKAAAGAIPISFTALLEMDTSVDQSQYIGTWATATKLFVDTKLLAFLRERPLEVGFNVPADVMLIAPLAITAASGGADLTGFREVLRYDNMMIAFSKTRQYEAAGTVWMCEVSADPVVDTLSVSQVESAMAAFSKAAFLQSSNHAASRRFSFDVPLPLQVVDPLVAQRRPPQQTLARTQVS